MAVSEAVRATFAFLDQRARAYCLTFQKTQPANIEVLVDLARFCRANESTFHKDPYMAARLDGRREVWLRIQQHLNLNPEQLMMLYVGNQAGIFESGEKK